ncbi:MAG TPA: thioredoxin-like domain-containing protein [Candidatus Kapabacteria bacterium]|nr:thioredoxin-like domain-containing protein [Candidatus Kapabacteria bacterium]
MNKLIGFFLLLITSPVFSQITVEGTVTDANGKAPILAHAHIGQYNDMEKSTDVLCDQNGHFTVQVPAFGIYSLRLSAVNHQEVNVQVILDGTEKDVIVSVRLQTNAYQIETPKVTGDWNKFAFSTAEVMKVSQTAGGKTIYTAELTATADTLAYQLLGVAGEHSVNGTQADYFSYDGGGDYRSVIKTHKGDKVTVTFDPEKLPATQTTGLPIIEFKNSPFLKRSSELSTAINKMHRETFPDPSSETPVSAEKYKELFRFIQKAQADANTSGDKRLAEFATVMLVKEFTPEAEFGTANAELVLQTVRAESPLWVFAPNEIIEVTKLAAKERSETYRNALKKNPQKLVRAIALATEMQHAISVEDKTNWKSLYVTLKNDYNDVPEVKWFILQNNPDALVQTGKLVPSFELALLDGSGNVSNTSMLGKYYMIDFWATWCGPCVHEMPAVHKAYEKFRGKKGFEILSISMDAKQDNIAPFRAKKWKMPWLHAFIPGVFNADLAKKFEIAGIPKPILVSPEGKIVAKDDDLRGENLEKTLAKYLGEPN